VQGKKKVSLTPIYKKKIPETRSKQLPSSYSCPSSSIDSGKSTRARLSFFFFFLTYTTYLVNLNFYLGKIKSTKDAIATIITNLIENLNNKIEYNCVLTEFPKAFECIEHNVLTDKLYQYGACGIPHILC
jgi:hypothetical protein